MIHGYRAAWNSFCRGLNENGLALSLFLGPGVVFFLYLGKARAKQYRAHGDKAGDQHNYP